MIEVENTLLIFRRYSHPSSNFFSNFNFQASISRINANVVCENIAPTSERNSFPSVLYARLRPLLGSFGQSSELKGRREIAQDTQNNWTFLTGCPVAQSHHCVALSKQNNCQLSYLSIIHVYKLHLCIEKVNGGFWLWSESRKWNLNIDWSTKTILITFIDQIFSLVSWNTDYYGDTSLFALLAMVFGKFVNFGILCWQLTNSRAGRKIFADIPNTFSNVLACMNLKWHIFLFDLFQDVWVWMSNRI